MRQEDLIGQIDSAYRRLAAAEEDLASADRQLSEHIGRVRLDNAEALLAAKNERTANLYLEGFLDTDEHRSLQVQKTRAELDLRHARREVEHLHLVVRLVASLVPSGAGSP